MSLMRLPPELLTCIADSCMTTSQQDCNSLARTCSFIYANINRTLYRRNREWFENSAVRWAAEAGSLKTLLLAHDAGADLAEPSLCLLHITLINGHTDIARFLISDCNADLTISDPRVMPPLFYAIASGELKSLELLVEFGVALEADDWSLVAIAAEHGSTEILRYLLANGHDFTSAKGRTIFPIQHAVIKDKVECTRQLLEHGADPMARQPGDFTPLHRATSEGSIEMVKLLLDYGADLQIAREGGNMQITPLVDAIVAKSAECVKLLIDKGADLHRHVNAEYRPIVFAICNGSVDVVEVFLEAGAEVEAHSVLIWSPLLLALSAADEPMITLLLRYGANINGDPSSPETPLSHAVQDNRADLVKELVRHGADIEQIRPFGHTALIEAAQLGHVDVAVALLQAGANTEALENDGATFGGVAAGGGSIGIVQAAIDCPRVSIDHQDQLGMTMLHRAAFNGHLDIVNLLLENDADHTVTDSTGDTAKDLARAERFRNIVRRIEGYTTIDSDSS